MTSDLLMERQCRFLTVSVTKNLQLKPIPGHSKGREEVNESCKDFVLVSKTISANDNKGSSCQ